MHSVTNYVQSIYLYVFIFYFTDILVQQVKVLSHTSGRAFTKQTNDFPGLNLPSDKIECGFSEFPQITGWFPFSKVSSPEMNKTTKKQTFSFSAHIVRLLVTCSP